MASPAKKTTTSGSNKAKSASASAAPKKSSKAKISSVKTKPKAAKKSPAKKKKAAAPKAKKPSAKKAAKKAAPKKSSAKKASPKKSAAKKTASKKPAAKKASPKKSSAKKPAAKKKAKSASSPRITKISVIKAISSAQERPVTTLVAESTRAVEQALSNGVAGAQEAAQSALEASKQSADKLAENADLTLENMNVLLDLSKNNLEALFKSGDVLSKAAKSMNDQLSDLYNKLYREQARAAEKMLSCEEPEEAFDIQNKCMMSSLDRTTKQCMQLQHTVADCLQSCVKPIEQELDKTIKKISKIYQ